VRRCTIVSGPQFLRYEQGDFFVRHQDGNTRQLDFDHLRVRRISIVVFLNVFQLSRRMEVIAAASSIFTIRSARSVSKVRPGCWSRSQPRRFTKS
jgi:hypothetical protein